MIAHDICYPSGDSFDQLRILFECEGTADSCLVIGIGPDLAAEIWVFSDLSVAVAVPGQIVKAYPSLKHFLSHC